MAPLYPLVQSALVRRSAALVRGDIRADVGYYLKTTTMPLLDLEVRDAEAGLEYALKRLAELAFQANDLELLKEVHARYAYCLKTDVHYWAAIAYTATACGVWYARTVGVDKDMLLDKRCDLEYSTHSRTASAFLVFAHAYSTSLLPSDLVDVCVQQNWAGWVHAVQGLGGVLEARHVHMLRTDADKGDIELLLNSGLYAALEQYGGAADWKALADALRQK